MINQTIDHTSFKHLLQAGAVRNVCAVYLAGQTGGWALSVRYGTVEAAITARRSGQLRTWAKLDTVTDHLHKLGVGRFEVDASQYQPGTMRRRRPDRAEAMRLIHEKAASK
ncbi:hypothetical protein [Comamonas odontotermitis]|uniref:hypothetical protein n=1 Tax=Comamonas odontotermitis TaxID=379895 RepID=UPI00366AC887